MSRVKTAGGEPVELNLGDYDFPIYHGDLETPDSVKKLAEDWAACDGVIITTPEYNGSLPPVLKNAIDWTSTVDKKHFTGPVHGIASCSPGPMSGIMCMRQVNYVLMRLGAEVLPVQVGTGNASKAFDDAGHLTAQPSSDLADKMISQMMTRIAQKG